MTGKVTGYSSTQIALHWAVVVLVAFQFVAHDGIESAWRNQLRGAPDSADVRLLAYMHIAGGLLILLLALIRLWLRFTRGAPAPPADEPRLMQLFAEGIHWLIYLMLLLLPATGLIAWFLGVRLAGEAHEAMKNILLGAIVLHVAGALFQHFIRRSHVLMRMLRPEAPPEGAGSQVSFDRINATMKPSAVESGPEPR